MFSLTGYKNQVLPAGTHDYSLICTLPDNLPSTFSGAYGDIKYTANVIVHRALWLKLKTEKICEEKFTVFKTVDLNVYPSLRVSFDISNSSDNHIYNKSISFFLSDGSVTYRNKNKLATLFHANGKDCSIGLDANCWILTRPKYSNSGFN